METVLGVDPGLSGALAVIDVESKKIQHLYDMPTWLMTIGRKKRKKIDPVRLYNHIKHAKSLKAKVVVIEQVGGRPKQSAPAAFSFGYSAGLLYMACASQRLEIEMVAPALWKKVMNVPGKTQASPDAIIARATELFPDERERFYGPKGGPLLGRAEACMLARFGIDFIVNREKAERKSSGG